ncbi:MAG: PBP1A family penicillin-binding protein [bacterium]
MTRTRGILLALAACLVLAGAAAVAGLFGLRGGLPTAEEVAGYRAPASTRVYDRHSRLVHEFYTEKRRPVPLDTIPVWLRKGIILVEDRRFYSHWGIDLMRLPGLAWWMLRHPGRVKGTSTITQQLARSIFLTHERTVTRKVREALLALEIERQFSKDEILELYLNQVWLGGPVYGVESAAERYFGRRVSALSVAECAVIAAMIANPGWYSPYGNPDRLLARRDFFLARLRTSGVITPAQFEEAKAETLRIRALRDTRNDAPYFVEDVRRYLMERYGPDFVYRSGAAVHTTLDLDIQLAANRVLEDRIARLEADYRLRRPKTWYDSVVKLDTAVGRPEYLQGALVVLDVATGEVRAMVGGRDFRQSEWNRASQAARQTGSSFKPFLWCAAIDNGFTVADVLVDSTIELKIPGQPVYRPRNYDHKLLGPVSVRRALALSRNLVAVRLAEKLGPQLLARYANLCGINRKLLPVYSLALGSVEVTLLEMTAAFTTFANEGRRVKPSLITSVRDGRGLVLEETRAEVQPVLSRETAYLMTSLMESVVNEGTATAIRSLGYTGPAAGKTGTTDEYSDAWFVGYTPSLACGVWVGYDRKRTIFRGATGGGVAAPVWGELMKEIRADTLAPAGFAVPEDIVTAPVCEASGLLATPRCPRVRYEVFARTAQPTATCNVHAPAPRPAPAPDSFVPLNPAGAGGGR